MSELVSVPDQGMEDVGASNDAVVPENADSLAEPSVPSSSDLPSNSVNSLEIDSYPSWQRTVQGQIERLNDIARAIRSGEVVPAVTVRAFLSWFWGSQRRGSFIVSHIREKLEEAGLRTVPDFQATYLDAEISFALETQDDGPSVDTIQQIARVIEIPKLADVSVTTSAFADPTYRISKLAAANRTPISVKPDARLSEAITLMMANDFSQLPVMTNEREVKGVISWETIGRRLALGQTPDWVREAMDPHAEISSEASLFTAIPIIVEQGYALVRASNDKRIVGIITTSDLSLQFQQLSEPFLLLGEIENHIRRIISSRFTREELEALKDPTDGARAIESVSDLTFGEYKRLLEDPSRWHRLDLNLDRAIFVDLLEKVREIRNDVMHFDPDGIEDRSLTVLRDFAKFLRALQTIGAT